jgi:hypothetical protein
MEEAEAGTGTSRRKSGEGAWRRRMLGNGIQCMSTTCIRKLHVPRPPLFGWIACTERWVDKRDNKPSIVKASGNSKQVLPQCAQDYL